MTLDVIMRFAIYTIRSRVSESSFGRKRITARISGVEKLSENAVNHFSTLENSKLSNRVDDIVSSVQFAG